MTILSDFYDLYYMVISCLVYHRKYNIIKNILFILSYHYYNDIKVTVLSEVECIFCIMYICCIHKNIQWPYNLLWAFPLETNSFRNILFRIWYKNFSYTNFNISFNVRNVATDGFRGACNTGPR